jgi:hypothetical protein
VLRRQETSAKFISHLKDDSTWWRTIVPSIRSHHFHLDAEHKRSVHDVEIEWVSEVLGFEYPGHDLPPPAK